MPKVKTQSGFLNKIIGGQSLRASFWDGFKLPQKAAPADVSLKRAKTERSDGTASAAEDRHQAELLEQLEKLQEKKKMLLQLDDRRPEPYG